MSEHPEIPAEALEPIAGHPPLPEGFVPTKYNPEPGVQLPQLELDDMNSAEAAKIEEELGAELRGLDDEEFQRRRKQAYRELQATREMVQPILAKSNGLLGDSGPRHDAYRVLARAEERMKLFSRIHNVRLGRPPEIFIAGGGSSFR